MWKLITFVLAFSVATGILLLTAFSHEQPKDDKQKAKLKRNDDKIAFMEKKLAASQKIVKGLATEDFDLIADEAQSLMLISQEANWKLFNTKPYLKLSSEFRASAERLRDSANSQNLDGSTLAYFEVTLNCVRCHKYIRQQQK